MNNQTRKLLFDVLESTNAIRDWCARRTFDEYISDRQFRRAVEREFEVIGEALARLRRINPALANTINQLNRVVDFRNRIIHGYDSVDDATVWGFVADRLPQLVAEVSTLFRGSDASD